MDDIEVTGYTCPTCGQPFWMSAPISEPAYCDDCLIAQDEIDCAVCGDSFASDGPDDERTPPDEDPLCTPCLAQEHAERSYEFSEPFR